jgi:hypothetical protein
MNTLQLFTALYQDLGIKARAGGYGSLTLYCIFIGGDQYTYLKGDQRIFFFPLGHPLEHYHIYFK